MKGVAVGMESSSWDGEMIVVSGGSASYLEASGLSRSQMAGIPCGLHSSSGPIGGGWSAPSRAAGVTQYAAIAAVHGAQVTSPNLR